MSTSKYRTLRRRAWSVIVSLLMLWVLMMPGTSLAENCNWLGRTASWKHYYDGQLSNGEAVRVVIAFHNCSITGTWFDSVLFTDATLDGKMNEDGSVTLSIKRSNRNSIGTLRGHFFPTEFYLKNETPRDPNITGVLFGLLQGPPGLNGQMVRLTLTRWWNGTKTEFLNATGIRNLTDFNDATLRFWRAVRDHDTSKVAGCIHYPLRVSVTDPKTGVAHSAVIDNSESMIREYDSIFTWHRTYEIMTHLPRNLTWGYYKNTIMLGDNVVLFNSNGQVIALP